MKKGIFLLSFNKFQFMENEIILSFFPRSCHFEFAGAVTPLFENFQETVFYVPKYFSELLDAMGAFLL